MAGGLHVLDYLDQPQKHEPRPMMVVFGEDRFLKRLAIDQMRQHLLSGADAEFSQAVFDGNLAALRDVRDELATVALFGGGGRLVIVEEADDFVSRNRAALEDYAASPHRASTLLLDVRTWPANTRLYKAVAASGLQIEASPPAPTRLRKWLASWSKKQYSKGIAPDAIDQLVEIVGPDSGRLDQELAKLTAATGNQPQIELQDVIDYVGGWRAKTTWDMLDAALSGNAQTAIVELDRLLAGGENAVGLLAQMGSSLRRLAAATRLLEQAESAGRRVSLRMALEEAGVRPFLLSKTEGQLRQLGRERAGKLYAWLVEADLALKGDSEAPPRLVLEGLIARMSNKLAPRAVS